jgi:hypothetical protein
MDIKLSKDDLAFETEVREFLAENAYKNEADPNKWRLDWFETARAKGGWDVPNGQQTSAALVGRLISIIFGRRKPLAQVPPGICPLV